MSVILKTSNTNNYLGKFDQNRRISHSLIMENAVMVLETAIKDVEAKLDTIAWKLESYEKGALSYIKKNDSRKNVSVIELMQNIQDIKNDFAMLRLEVIDMEERNKEIKNSVTAELDSTLNEFSKLKAKLKDR